MDALSTKIKLQITSGNPKAIGMPVILSLFFQQVMSLLQGRRGVGVKKADILIWRQVSRLFCDACRIFVG